MLKKKKRGGPVTVAGKQAVSRNALTHGATSPRLLSDEESEQYQSFARQLTSHYLSGNPLVAMQIERIARLQVQLTRIQDTIDAAFQKCRRVSSAIESLVEELGMQPDDIFLVGLPHETFGKEFEKVQLQVTGLAVELDNPIEGKPTNHETILATWPNSCLYLFQHATDAGTDIAGFLKSATRQGARSPQERIKQVIRAIVALDFYRDLQVDESVRKAIEECDLAVLQQGAEWLRVEIAHMAILVSNILEYNRLYPAYQKVTTPDLDQLDKLMRYQTTLQRQLSTAIGELLELTRIQDQ